MNALWPWPPRGGRTPPGPRHNKLALAMAAALAGGSLFSACDTRLRDAAVDGSKSYLFSLLDPTTLIEALVDDTETP